MHGGAYISGTCYHSFWISSRPRRYLALIRDVRSFLLRDPFVFFFSFSSRSFLFSISFEQNRVLAVLGLWKGDMCSKGCGLYFSKGFFIRNNYVGSGFQAELEASSRFILFFLSIISFPFFFIDSLACFYYSSRSGTIIEKVEKVAS